MADTIPRLDVLSRDQASGTDGQGESDSRRESRIRLIVTGCGRSGTTSLSDVLSAAGLRCGHEKVFTVFGPKEARGFDADSSWFAAPFLSTQPEDVRVIHLVRNPTRVVESFLRIGVCAVDPWHHFTFGRPLAYLALRYNVRWYRYRRRWQYVMAHRRLLAEHTTCLEKGNEVDRLWAYWWQWNSLVERGAESGRRPYLRVRLEDLDDSLPEIREFLDWPVELRSSRITNRKRGYRMRAVEWTPMPAEVRSLAQRYGYDDSELEVRDEPS